MERVLRTSNSTVALHVALREIEAARRAQRLPHAVVLELRLVAEEVLTNIAKYAHPEPGEHSTEVRLRSGPDEVTLKFRDEGQPFDPLATATARPDRSRADSGGGGLGLHLVRSLVESARYSREGACNVLTLTKHVGRRSGAV